MVFRPMFQRRVVTPMAATLLAGGVVLYPRTAYAEAPQEAKRRRPIYDDLPSAQPETLKPRQHHALASSEPVESSSSPSASSSPSTSANPTPTDILTGQVRQARLFLYAHSLAAENAFNDFLSRVLRAENAFTDTIASLAPPPESGERLLPGGIYVLVTAMAGSIVSRNRGILLRSATPLAFGTVAAWTLLPVTMRNISDFAWEYEKKIPALADTHLKARERAERFYYTGVAHSAHTRALLEEKIGDGRKKLEEWVRQG